MSYALPPNGLIRSLVMDDGPAADERRRKLAEQEVKLRARSWLTVDPGRGPVSGLNGFSGRRR
jgi:hypothetical protein